MGAAVAFLPRAMRARVHDRPPVLSGALAVALRGSVGGSVPFRLLSLRRVRLPVWAWLTAWPCQPFRGAKPA